jgi:hypothetical protein
MLVIRRAPPSGCSTSSVLDPKPRIKFTVKLLQALQLTARHPTLVPSTGIAWCSDGRHFVSHPRILSVALNLKQNSINTNFREHGFEIVACTSNSIIEHLGNVPEPHLWKMRICMAGDFTRHTTLEAADRIQCQKAPKLELVQSSTDSDSQRSSFQPRATLSKLCPPSSPDHTTVIGALGRAQATAAWKVDALDRIVNDWVAEFHEVFEVTMDEFFASVLAAEERHVPQLRSNIRALIQSCCGRSQPGKSVSFADYLHLMLRFGPITRFLQSVKELSKLRDTFDSSFPSERPEFQRWFHPDATDRAAARLLEQHPPPAWLVRPASVPNVFALQRRTGVGQATLRIRYDGLDPDGNVFAVDWADEGTRYAASWTALFDLLAVEIGQAVEPSGDAYSGQTTWVTGDQLAARRPVEEVVELDLPIVPTQDDPMHNM